MAFKVLNASDEKPVSPVAGNASDQATFVDPVTGATLTVWMSDGAIWLRTVSSQGDELFEDIINPGGGASGFPSIAPSSIPNFYLITWEEEVGSGDFDVKSHLVDINGDEGKPIATLNTYTDDYQDSSTVTSLPGGGFVVAWESYKTLNNSGYNISFRILDQLGDPIGGEKQANTITAGSQQFPVVTALSNGSFVIAWQDDAGGLWYRQYDSAGNPIGASTSLEQPIGTGGAAKQLPAIAALPGGRWVATWQEDSANDYDIRVQIFDSIGTAGPVQNVTTAPGAQSDPSIAALSDGGFVIVWTDAAGDVRQHVFDSTWQPLGAESVVGKTVPGNLSAPTVSALANGGWLVSWTGPDGDGTGIFQRTYTGSPGGNLSVGADLVLGSAATETLKVEAGELTAGDEIYGGGGGGDTLQMVGDKLIIPATAIIEGFSDLAGTSDADTVTVENGNLPFAGIDLGDGTDTLVFDGSANLVGKVLTGVEKIVLLEGSDITLDNKALALLVSAENGGYNVLTLTGGDTFSQPEINALFAAGIDEIHHGNVTVVAPALLKKTFDVLEEVAGATLGKLGNASGSATFALVSNSNYNGLFEITGNATDGYVLKLKAGEKLDYETDPSTIGLQIEVTDANGTVVVDVVVTLTPVNEYTPKILSPAAFDYAENATNTVVTVIATDGDVKDTTLGYSITGTDAGLFKINGKGELSFKAAPDWESPQDATKDNVYDVIVEVTDGPYTDSQAIKITILDGDDPPSIPKLTFAAGVLDENGRLPEGTAAGTVIGVLSATDPDGKPVSFSVDNGAFKVIENAEHQFVLVVEDASKIDYEAGGEITFTVTATTGVGPDSESVFTVPLADVDEAATKVVVSSFINLIDENTPVGPGGIEIATLGAVDPDSGKSSTTFEVADGPDAAFFQVRDENGVWKLFFVGPAPDYETKSHYDIVIETKGGLGPSVSQPFSLLVANLNDAPSEVTFANALASIAENTVIPVAADGTIIGIKVADFTVEDDALGSHEPSLAGEDRASFAIRPGVAPKTYELWFVGASPNFEAPKTAYSVDIVVDDETVGGTPDVTQNFTIAVGNVNEAPSAAALAGATANELAAAGSVVGTLSASDPDAGAVLTFSLVNDAGGRFAIADGNKVVVKNGLLLDAEQAAAHQITVRVSDGLNTVDKVFSISVGDINPEFTAGSAANDVFVGGAAGDTLFGNLGNDRLVGGLGLDTLRGEAGNDEVRGGGGKDKLFGGDGNDTLFGDADTDTIKGDKGNDTLFGGLGNKDLLYGGLGKDAFAFDTKLGKTNVDTIKDFYAKDDKIFLDNAVFTKLGAGTLVKPKALSKGAFFVGTKAHDKDDRIVATKTKKGYDLSYDADGLGGKAQVKFGTIEFDKLDHKKFILTAADFFVI